MTKSKYLYGSGVRKCYIVYYSIVHRTVPPSVLLLLPETGAVYVYVYIRSENNH